MTKRLTELGGMVHEDNAGEKLGGNCGNLVADFPASDAAHENIQTIMLTAHMDCVEPCEGVKPVLDNGIIRSDGTTILGGDDKAGVVAVLETLRQLKEKIFRTVRCRWFLQPLRKTEYMVRKILIQAFCIPTAALPWILMVIQVL